MAVNAAQILRFRVNRRSDLPYNDTVCRFDGLLLKNWRPPFEVPWKTAKAVSVPNGHICSSLKSIRLKHVCMRDLILSISTV